MSDNLHNIESVQPNENLECLSIELVPNIEEAGFNDDRYTKIPFGQLASLGVGLSGIGVMAQTVMASGGAGSGEVLYRIANSDTAKGTLQMIKGQPGATYGTYMQDGVFSQRAVFEQVAGNGAAPTIPIDPTAIFMAAALASINHKLDVIQATQQEMFEYARKKNESEMKGDLKFLVETFNNYKNAWNNDLFIQSSHNQTLTCKRHAMANIDFYRDEIVSKTNEKDFLHGDKKVEKKLEALDDYFKDFQMALTMYAFSSFMDVILSKNYEKGYLDYISQNLRELSYKYRELYTECYNRVAIYANQSVESMLRRGLSKASKATSSGLENAPLLNKTPLGDNLIQVSVKLKEYDEDKREEPLKILAENSSATVMPYVESIEDINRYYNEPMDVMFDKEYIYIPA